jgi:hypothetical protein
VLNLRRAAADPAGGGASTAWPERQPGRQTRHCQPRSCGSPFHEAGAVETDERGANARSVGSDSFIEVFDGRFTSATRQSEDGTKDHGFVVHGRDLSAVLNAGPVNVSGFHIYQHTQALTGLTREARGCPNPKDGKESRFHDLKGRARSHHGGGRDGMRRRIRGSACGCGQHLTVNTRTGPQTVWRPMSFRLSELKPSRSGKSRDGNQGV